MQTIMVKVIKNKPDKLLVCNNNLFNLGIIYIVWFFYSSNT